MFWKTKEEEILYDFKVAVSGQAKKQTSFLMYTSSRDSAQSKTYWQKIYIENQKESQFRPLQM